MAISYECKTNKFAMTICEQMNLLFFCRIYWKITFQTKYFGIEHEKQKQKELQTRKSEFIFT